VLLLGLLRQGVKRLKQDVVVHTSCWCDVLEPSRVRELLLLEVVSLPPLACVKLRPAGHCSCVYLIAFIMMYPWSKTCLQAYLLRALQEGHGATID
jgi:hypothetical protein